MTHYSQLFQAISALESRNQDPILVKPTCKFPLPQIYPQQQQCLEQMKGELEASNQIALTSHTGSGKTPVFRALAYGKATLIIEPRKFLQKQAASYCKDFVLFGKSEYPCKHAHSAATAPCSKKVPCDLKQIPDDCRNAVKTCSKSHCSVFTTRTGTYKYPCSECAYLSAQKEAARVLRHKGVVICNFGNFWNLLKDAELVIVDEADLFFTEISKPMAMKFTKPAGNLKTIKAMLTDELKGLETLLKESPASEHYKLQNAIYNVEFLLDNADLCFTYQRKDRIYVEINPENVSILKDKLFEGKKLVIVSATLGDFDIPAFSYSIWQRRGIFYVPVGKMTSRNLKQNPWLMNRAAEMIEIISNTAEGLYDTSQFVAHCGNIGNHATKLYDLLGHDQCTLHERGNLMKTIEDFLKDGKRFLLVASADYGADFSWCKCQFILKYPYAGLDERMRTLERVMGKGKFNEFYRKNARNRFCQQSGRNTRGHNDFGFTIVMDSKFPEEYNEEFPGYVKDSYDGKVY